MIRYFKKVIQSASQSSFKGFLKLMRDALYQNVTLVVYRSEALSPEEKREFNSTDVRKGNIEEIEDFTKRVKRVPWEFKCHQFDGVKDFFIKGQNNIQHISWVYYPGDPNRFIQLGPNDIEIKYCYTFPEFRGKGIYPGVLKAIREYFYGTDIQFIYMCTDTRNHSSIRGIEKAGFNRIKEIHFKRILTIQISKRYIPNCLMV